jgi:hypothetical protein
MAKKQKEQSYSVIESEAITPYKIYVEESQYTVVQPEKTYEKTWGYFSTLEGALRKITKLKTLEQKEFTLESYITRYEEVQARLLKEVRGI